MAALAVSAGMLACDDDSKINGEGPDAPDAVVPNFPELVEDYAVLPGSVLEVVFTPNLAWEISIPTESRQWFWIKDGSFSVTELQGKASEEPVTVQIGVTENAEFDKNHSCDVTLTMADSSKVIAKYMLPAKEKTMTVYMAQKDETGAFKRADDGETYVYETEAVTEGGFVWDADAKKFILPLRIESNCEWTVSKPEWADVNVPENTAGVVELVMSGFSLDAAEGKLIFSNGETILNEIAVNVPQGKEMTVYSAFEGEDGFESDGDSFVWNDAPAEKLELIWSGADFRLPVLFDAKCNWTAELPEWLQVVTYPALDALPAETSGQIVALLKGVPSKYPLDDTEAKIAFKVGQTVVHEVTASIPGCKGIMTYSLAMTLTKLEYNYLGAVNTSTGYVDELATGHVFGTKDVRIFAVETTGGKVGNVLSGNDAWFRIEVGAFVEGKDQSVLQEREMTFSVAENMGDDRSAMLFILPPTVTAEIADLFNEDASVKDDYMAYAVPVSQGSMNYAEYIKIPEAADAGYTFERVTDDAHAAALVDAFGETSHIYTLRYSDAYASDNAVMTLAIPYTSFHIFDDDMNDRTSDEEFWLAFNVTDEDNRTAGAAEMYLGQALPPLSSVGYVVFKGTDGKILAIVECVSPAGDYITMPSNDAGLSYAFVNHSDAKKTELSSAFGSTDNVYRMTYTDAMMEVEGKNVLAANVEAIMTLSIPFVSYKIFDSDKVTEKTNDGDFWLSLQTGDDVIAVMYKDKKLPVEPSVGYIVFYGEDGDVYAIVECISPVGKAEEEDPDTKLDVSSERFVDPAAAEAVGAKVYEITAGPTFDRYKEYSCPVLKLVYTKPNTSLLVNVPTNTFLFTLYENTVEDYLESQTWLKVDGKDMYNDAGYIWEWTNKGYVGSSPDGKSYDGTAEISMNASTSASANMLLHPRDSGESSVVCVIVCVLDLE